MVGMYVCVPNVDYSRLQRFGIHGVNSSIMNEEALVKEKPYKIEGLFISIQYY